MDKELYLKPVNDRLKEVIKNDVQHGTERTHVKYLDIALATMKDTYKAVNKRKSFQVWSMDNTKEITKLWLEIQPDVIQAIDKHLKQIKHRQMTKDIMATTAKAAIRVAMREAELKFHFVAQAYRARISVQITSSTALTFYVAYKNVSKQLPQIIESLKVIRQNAECLGTKISLDKIYNHTGWE